MDELRKKTVLGSLWVTISRFGYLTIQFVSNLVLARLLTPADFGTIGILMVFVALSHVLIDSGLSASLIQKKDITNSDKSTVFFTNMIFSLIVYLFIFVLAPFISNYFNIPELTLLIRVLEAIVIIDAFCAIQSTLLSREMNFKRLTKIRLTSIFIAAIVSIILAYNGFGIWSLIVQYILYSLLRASITWVLAKWRPSLTFSINSFKELFGYGSKLLLSSFVAELYINFQQILIGRYYTPADLGYYSQARQFQQIPTGTITQVINSVSFPAYAKLQDDRIKLMDMFRQNVRLVSFFNTAIMILLAVIAKPLIILLYSDKWIGAIEYFQFLCIGFGILLAIHQCSLSVLKAVGRSDYVLKLEIIKKILGILFILIGINIWGLWGILYALALNSVIEIFLNGYCIKKEINYGGIEQLKDLFPSLVVALIAGFLSYMILTNLLSNSNELISVVLISIIYAMIFIGTSAAFNLYGFQILRQGIMKIIKK